jgi:Bromodomain
MLRMLMDYDFGDVFRSPVNCREFPSYNKIVSKPMDLGTISSCLEKGKYDCKSIEGVVLSILKDIELVWHNCFMFNVEGSAVYRMAIIHKRRAHEMRQRSFDHMISDHVKNELADYITSLEVERCKHSSQEASSLQPRSTSTPTSQTRHKIIRQSKPSGKTRPIAILDADSGKLLKIYSTMQSAWKAMDFVHKLNRHECEFEFNEVDTVLKLRKLILDCQDNPTVRLYGYRWLYLDDLRSRKVKFSRAAPKSIENSFYGPIETIRSGLVEMVSDGKSFLFHSVDEAMSCPDIPNDFSEIRQRVQDLVPGTEFEVIAGHMLKRIEPDIFESYGAEYIKEDVLNGETVLCSFVHIDAAYEDWCRTLDASIATTEDSRSLDVFSRSYLDRNKCVDGIRWKRVPSRSVEDDTDTIVAQSKSSDEPVNISASLSGMQQETSSTTTQSTENSAISRFYDLETVPSPKKEKVKNSDCIEKSLVQPRLSVLASKTVIKVEEDEEIF